ncbi:MAG TPA: chromosome segregation protein SMC, partial [Lacipirellulaceae bacterium]|nr:chromosome segregation protein SMC [Lacipirellulaceae bacterium]
MLKALELFGFKSFADRTRLEFPAGISVVVGPNGSGKSNIVDAVKWVLGSQSVKSLRGKEMTDVIFNGCTTRGPAGTGEVTITLDNSAGRLAIDTKEVHVARRVYRSGEGEYLLNRQPCRLRDIRELLAATGITTEAYCIIEQGKVDALLQSSPRDRRIIFEEAAGISQFKIKKAAAMRRMERVEQNLLRLSDIVDEVESRLRSVRQQAGKARRYRECTERLKQLRTEVALVDWRALTRQLTSREAQLADLRSRIERQQLQLDGDEAACQDCDHRIEVSNQHMRQLEADSSSTREQIAALQTTAENQKIRRVELEHEVGRIREQLVGMLSHGGTADERVSEAAQQLSVAEAELESATVACKRQNERADELERSVNDVLTAQAVSRENLEEHVRAVSLLTEQIAALESQLPVAAADLAVTQTRIREWERLQCELSDELSKLEMTEAEVAALAEQHRTALSGAEQRLAEVRREIARADVHYRRTEAHLTRVRERIAVLTELEGRLDGLGRGVQDFLRLASESSGDLPGQVHGVVADLFHVDVDTASLIEVALGERAQFVVISSAKPLVNWFIAHPRRVADRVGFLSLDIRHPVNVLDNVDLADEPGVMGRADRFVESAPEYQPLARRLLGRTWLVDQLSTALGLSQTTGRGLEFVTSDGEFLAADGTLIIGPRQAATGVLSRRSELRSCHEKARDLERQASDQSVAHSRLDEERMKQESLVASSISAYTAAADKLADARRHTASRAARLEHLIQELGRLRENCRQTEERIATIHAQIEANRQKQAEFQVVANRLETQLSSGQQELALLREQHDQARAAATDEQIVLARTEQRVEMLRLQLHQVQRSQHERDQLLADLRAQLEARETQIVELEEAIRVSQQALAKLFEAKQCHGEQFAEQAAIDEQLRRERA